jgi:hypothetical protein
MKNWMDKRELMLKHDLEGVNSETTEKTRIQTLRANPGPFLILEQNDRSLISDR